MRLDIPCLIYIRPGDVVTLKTQFSPMIVREMNPNGVALCSWNSGRDVAAFDSETLMPCIGVA
jgi:uncharacterized protein YodC (DUF2158 family)